MAEARSILSQTWGRMLPSIHRLPEEILSEIFTYHLFTFKSPPDPGDINEQRIVAYHRRLYTLLSVCSMWKNVVVSRGMFWSIVPMVHPMLKSECAATLGLERSQGRPLHFVALLPEHPSHFPDLESNAPRFRTINISTGPGALDAVRTLLSQFYNSTSAEQSLSQLSLCHTSEPLRYGRFPLLSDYVFEYDSPEQQMFNRLIRNLSILRVKGARFPWTGLVFSHHLTELHLQDIMMSFDSWLLAFIKVLSGATQLRDLKFIGVRTSPDHEIPVSRIPFPSLETLLLRDICSNTLRPLLAISSATYRLNLFLNENSFLLFTELDDTPTHVHIEQFCTLFEEVSVHTLLLEGELDGWLAPTDLSDLIISMADLKSLKFHKWRLDEDLCDALTRPPELDTAFPSLQSLHISHSTVWDVAMFRDMIASHSASLELVRLGIDIYEEQGGSHWKFLDAGEPTEFWRWLRETVPRLEVMDPKYVPPEFEGPHWRMWD